MKKLFALVLTLALVFALAAPAMAASWGDTDADGATDPVPFTVSVKLLQTTAATAPDGSTYYAEYPANLAVVANTPVRFMVSFKVPEKAELESYYGYAANTLPDGTLSTTLVLKNINRVNNAGTPVGALVSTPNNTGAGASTITLTGAAFGGSYVLSYTGVIMTTAEATVTAKLSFNGTLEGNESYGFLTKKVGATEYLITTLDINAGIPGEAGFRALMFTAPAPSKLITGWTLAVGTTAYYVHGAANSPVFVFASGAGPVDSTSPNYAALLAAYNELTGVLGFKYGDKVYYTAENILAFFGFAGSVTDEKAYKPYTASMTVTDGSNVPNTGDSVSVIGFVMVGLALLATAAVVVKKVRA